MAEENKSKGLLGGALERGGKVISAPFKFVGGALKLGGKAVDKVGRGILGDGIMDKAEAPFKLLGTVGKTIGNKLKTIPITMQLSALKSDLMVMAIEFINSLKSTLDKNNKSVAEAKETAAKKGYSTEQTMAKIDEKTKDTKIFKEMPIKGDYLPDDPVSKGLNGPLTNDIGNLINSKTAGSSALAGPAGNLAQDIDLNK